MAIKRWHYVREREQYEVRKTKNAQIQHSYNAKTQKYKKFALTLGRTGDAFFSHHHKIHLGEDKNKGSELRSSGLSACLFFPREELLLHLQ